MDEGEAAPDRRLWKPRLDPAARRKFLAIADALATDVRNGVVLAGDRLPTQRVVAQALGVDLTTVTKAYNEARRRGLIAATIGRGTFVAPQPDLPEDRRDESRAIDLSMNIPPQPEAADFASRIPDAMARILSAQGGALLAYQESGGTIADRQAGTRWLAPRLPGLEPQRTLLASGSQCAIFAICACVASKGDLIAAPALTYPGLQVATARLGIRLHPLAMDDGGLVPDAFEALCATSRPAALYLVPTIDNPTTATLTPQRRQRIAAIARQFGVQIIEDDPYGMLPDAPPAPIADMAPELTWHIATLAKCVSPALRIAYVAAPDEAAASRLASVLRATHLMASPLMAALASYWIETGEIDAITTVIRDENRARQAIAAEVFTGLPYRHHPRGHHLWLPLPEGRNALDFAYQAERSGLSVVPASSFALSAPGIEAVRVSLGPPGNRRILKRALDILAGLLRQAPPGGRILV